MGVFNDFGKKISQTSQDAVQKTKDLAEVSKLNSQINASQKTIKETYTQIGEKYFSLYRNSSAPELQQFVDLISSNMDKIEQLKADIQRVKKIAVCPKCGTECSTSTPFCGSCGTQLTPEPEEAPIDVEVTNYMFCSECGTKLSPDATFCNNCGHRTESNE